MTYNWYSGVSGVALKVLQYINDCLWVSLSHFDRDWPCRIYTLTGYKASLLIAADINIAGHFRVQLDQFNLMSGPGLPVTEHPSIASMVKVAENKFVKIAI